MECLKNPQNPTDMSFIEKVELEDSEEDLSITRFEFTEVVKQLLSGRTHGLEDINPEYP